MTLEAARQQVEQLSAVYQMSKFFTTSGDPNAIRQSGLFRPEEQAQLDWIARDPSVRQLLDNYESQRQEMIKSDKETIRIWGDGSQSTREQREAYLTSLTVREGLNAVTANIMGAIGGEVGRQLYPNDPEMAAKVASIAANYGELGISLGEGIVAGHENSEFRPGEPGMEQHAPGKLEEGPENPFESTFTKNKPLGTDSFNPYETEVESPEGEIRETPETPEEVDNSEHFDGGVPLGVQDGDPQDQARPDDASQRQDASSTDEPNQSFFENDFPNQSFPKEPNASFPEDRFPNQNVDPAPIQSFPENEPLTQPNASFPEDPISNQSTPMEPTQSFSSEPPVEQGMSIEPMQSIQPESSPMQSEPIESMPSEPMSSPESMESSAPAFDPQ
jgi:hypothetical protein